MRYILALLACLFASAASAQNVTCSTRPVGDNSNACASTAFVQSTTVRPPTLTQRGSVYAFNGVTSQWPWQLNTDGTWTLKQPTFADLAAGQVSIETAFSGQNFFAPAGQTSAANWLKTYMYGTDNTAVVSLSRSGGGIAITGAAKTSDASSTAVSTIGLAGFAQLDSVTYPYLPGWGSYAQCVQYNGTTGFCHGSEINFANVRGAISPVVGPWAPYPSGAVVGLQLASGADIHVDLVPSNVADNGSGKVRITFPTRHYLLDGNNVLPSGLTSVNSLLNGTTRYPATVVDAYTIDLATVTFSGSWTSGGLVQVGNIGNLLNPKNDPVTGSPVASSSYTSNGLNIISNPVPMLNAINIASNAIYGVSGLDSDTGQADAIKMSVKHLVGWYDKNSTTQFEFGSISKSTDPGHKLIETGSAGLVYQVESTTVHQFYASATAVNGVALLGGATGVSSQIIAIGSDTNVSLSISGKGSGLVNIVGSTFGGSTGYVYANGASAATFSTTIPTTALSGFLQAAQEPAHTGDMTNTAGSLATTVNSIGGKSVTLGGAFTMSGAYGFTGTLTGTTSVTFPTSGTLATTSATTTINGTACTLTSSCAVTAAAGTLTGSTLASGITDSSLTSVGTLTSLTVNGTVTVNANAFNMTSTATYQPQMTFFNQYNGSSGGYYIVQKGRGAPGSGASAVQVGDTLGTFMFKGLDSNGTATNSSSSIAAIVDAVAAGSVTSHLEFAGNVTFYAGVAVGAATGGYKGAGTINAAAAYYANGTAGVTCGSGLGGTSRTINGIVTTC